MVVVGYMKLIEFIKHLWPSVHIDGLVQKRRNSSALAMELHLSCTNLSICYSLTFIMRMYKIFIYHFKSMLLTRKWHEVISRVSADCKAGDIFSNGSLDINYIKYVLTNLTQDI